MSYDYKDSKGIRHNSAGDAELASQKHLRNEKYTAERTADAAEDAAYEARRQREAMESMAREAEHQRREEESHRREMRDLKERELSNQERQNRFNRDLLFLEKENPADRKDYVIKRVLEDMERGRAYLDPRVPIILPEGPEVTETVLRHLNSCLPRKKKEIAGLWELSRRRYR